MADKIIKFYGNAFAVSGDASIAVSVNGNEVKNGSIPTINSATPLKNTHTPVELFSFVINDTVTGILPVTVDVISGDVFVVGLGSDNDELSSAGGFWGNIDGTQLKTNVSYNNGPAYELTPDDGDEPGEIHLRVLNGDNVAFDYYLPPKSEAD